MSGTVHSDKECPACGTDKVSYWKDIDTWLCEECSYVMGASASLPPTPDSPEETATAKHKDQDWEASISVTDNSEANLVDVISQVEEAADNLTLNNEQTVHAAEIVTDAWKTNFMHGRTMTDTVGATLYAASREFEQSIPPSIVAEEIESDPQSVKDTYQQLKMELNLDIDPPTPTEYLVYICQELNLSKEVENRARDILAGYRSGGNPIGIAAAALYEADPSEKSELTLQAAGEATGLAKETIWRHSKKIREIDATHSE